METSHVKSLGTIIIFVVLVIILGLGIGARKNAQNYKITVTPGTMGNPVDEQIRSVPNNDISVENVLTGQMIHLPFTVVGHVKGTWFFEGSFPVFMKDINGNQLGIGLAESTQNWMTPDTIVFSVILPAVNYQGQGTLVFIKDNPSGDPQRDDSFTLPVIFQ